MSRSPSSKLSTTSLCIRDAFKSAYYEVPPNQREYRWGREQRERFWDDLVSAVKNDCYDNPADPEGHFLGAIVVIGQEYSMEQQRWHVIDGQQRLITITIVAECLRGYVDQLTDMKLRRSLGHVLWDCVVSPGSTVSPRIILNREDEFYKNTLVEMEGKAAKLKYWKDVHDTKSEVQVNIKRAFEYFYEKIDKYLDESIDKDEALRFLIETLTEGFYLLLVRTENTWMAYTLFETLNERGLDLTQADLIKNSILEYAKYIGSKPYQKASAAWIDLVDNYEAQSSKKLELPQIIQFSYTYRHGLVKKEKIFEQISGDLKSGAKDSLEFVGEFRRDSQSWVDFLLGDLINWPENLADAQYAIVEPLWKSHCAPFVMACMDKYCDTPEHLEKTVTLCENYLFRQGLVCRDSVSSIQEFFALASSHVRSGHSYVSLVELFKQYSPDESYKENFKTASVVNMKQGFYVIWKIEKHLGSKLGFRPKNQSAAQHLEHIMPRKPNKGWGEIQNTDEFSMYLNRIGNLLILPSDINTHIRNHSIDYKLKNNTSKDYATCELQLTKEFVREFDSWSDKGAWTFASIRNRQIHLADQYSLGVWGF